MQQIQPDQEPRPYGPSGLNEFPSFAPRPSPPSSYAVDFGPVGAVNVSGVVTPLRTMWPRVGPAKASPERATYQRAHSELQSHLATLQSKGVITESEMQEVLRQHEVLEEHRRELSGHVGETVVVAGGELFFGSSLDEAIQKATAKYGDRPHYSESVNIVEYPSLLG